MKKYSLLIFILLLTISFLFNSCRPPELEGAVVHFNYERYDEAYKLALESTEKYPDNPEAWFLLGRIQGKKGQIKEMVESFDKSLAINNTYEPDIKSEQSVYFSKYYNDAVSAYNTYIKIEDRESEAATKRLNSVIENFQNALQIKNDYMAHRLSSVAYTNLKDDENALKSLEKAKDADPDTILAWIDLGYYFSRKKEFNKAADYFKNGLEVDPDNIECLTLYAQNLDFADRRDDAIEAYKIAFEKNQQEKAIPFNLGLLLNKQANAIEDDDSKKKGLLEEAAVYFKKAQEIDPELKDVYDILSAVLIQLERFDEAEELLNKGIEFYPDSANMWQNLSFLYARTGKKKEAEEAYEKSKQLRGEE